MSYETIKSFILVLLVGSSLFLSFILWTYQPNYELIYDASYVNEADVGVENGQKVTSFKQIIFYLFKMKIFIVFQNRPKKTIFIKKWKIGFYMIIGNLMQRENLMRINILK